MFPPGDTVGQLPTKFYVVDSRDDTFEYDADGNLVESYDLTRVNNAPRGAAADATGDTVWVIDNDDHIYVYDGDGGVLGSWRANGLRQPEGIASDGEDIFIVDRGSDRLYFFDNAAMRTSGSMNATSSFPLDPANRNARGITTDGEYLWVVDAARRDMVYKYDVDGTPLGKWRIDSSNRNPRGIAIDPIDVNQIFIVDSGADKVFVYHGGVGHTSGMHAADGSFALDRRNSNPQGIADPPPPLLPSENNSASVIALADGYLAVAAWKPYRPTAVETTSTRGTTHERPSTDVVTNDRLWPAPPADSRTDAARLERLKRPRLPSSAADRAMVDLTEHDFLADDMVADLALALSRLR